MELKEMAGLGCLMLLVEQLVMEKYRIHDSNYIDVKSENILEANILSKKPTHVKPQFSRGSSIYMVEH